MVDFTLSADDKAIQDTARDFVRKEIIPVAARHDQTMEYPWEVFRKAHAIGLTNMSIPERFGGVGLRYLQRVLVQEEFAYGCTGISTAITTNDLALGPLIDAGTDDQIKEFTTPLLEEAKIAAYCVTEPGAGSDVQAIRTTAKKDGSDYIINGEKMWITGGGVASWFYVLASTDPSKGYAAMCAFIVPADLPGVKVGKKEINLGQRCSDTRGILFENVRVPKRYLLGEEGDGFKIAMRAFDGSRPGVAAGATGLAQRAMDLSIQYAKERRAFGKPIAGHQAVQFMIADMAKDIEAARLLTWKSAVDLDQGRRNTLSAAAAKCFAGDTAMRVATDAVQIFGGYGYNTEYPVEKLFRDAKIFQIYEGTQQIQRLIISRAVLAL